MFCFYSTSTLLPTPTESLFLLFFFFINVFLYFQANDVGNPAYEILQVRTEYARAYHALLAGIAEAEERKRSGDAGSTSILKRILKPVPYLDDYRAYLRWYHEQKDFQQNSSDSATPPSTEQGIVSLPESSVVRTSSQQL